MTLARRSAAPVTLDLKLGSRPGEHLEAAAYYIASEALANAAKHAQPRSERAGSRWPGISRILAKLGAKGRVEIVREGAAPRRLALAGARQPAPLRQSVVT